MAPMPIKSTPATSSIYVRGRLKVLDLDSLRYTKIKYGDRSKAPKKSAKPVFLISQNKRKTNVMPNPTLAKIRATHLTITDSIPGAKIARFLLGTEVEEAQKHFLHNLKVSPPSNLASKTDHSTTYYYVSHDFGPRFFYLGGKRGLSSITHALNHRCGTKR